MFNINEEINDSNYILETEAFKYHETSKLSKYNNKLLSKRINELVNKEVIKNMTKSYKLYSCSKQIEMPKAKLKKGVDFQKLIINRRSRRNFSDGVSLNIEQLANLLQLSYGATDEIIYKDEVQLLRATPSAGALYPLEIYVLSRDVEKLKNGIYHYRICKNSLEFIKEVDKKFYNELETTWLFPKNYQALIIITGVWNRGFIKYGERAYRYLLFESGIVSQNITLLCEAQGLGSLIMGGWCDDEINSLLGLDGINEISLVPICIGRYEND